MELFWSRGFAATSLRDLKEGLGVLPGSLYAAYGDKHGLFLRALGHYVGAAQEQATEIATGATILPGIRALLLEVLQAARTTPGRGCMLGNIAAELLPGDEAAGRLVHSAFSSLEAGLEQGLRAAQRSGEVRPGIDCGAQARLLLALMQGLHIVARAEADPQRLADAVDAALAPLTDPADPSSSPESRRTR